jgi:hypothetical protein
LMQRDSFAEEMGEIEPILGEKPAHENTIFSNRSNSG